MVLFRAVGTTENHILVEALDEDGNVIESDTIIHQTDSTPDETLDLELTVWTEEDSRFSQPPSRGSSDVYPDH